MLRILVTQDTDWLRRNPGQQHHVVDRLSERGHTITVIDFEILWRSENRERILSKRRTFQSVSRVRKGANITLIRPGMMKLPLVGYISMYITHSREINRQIGHFHPHVILGHSIVSSYLSMKAARKAGIPFIFHVNDANHTIVPEASLRPLAKLLEMKSIREADRVVVINEGLKDYVVRMGAAPSRVSIVRAGIDLESYTPSRDGKEIRNEYGLTKEDFVVFFMGWLYTFSGLREVIQELAKIDDPRVKLLIVGDGDDLEHLTRMSKQTAVSGRVILAGRQPVERIPDFIGSSNICILPAHMNEIMKDIVPIKLYEYMAMQKPVVATNLPGVRKEFGEGNGITYVDTPIIALREALRIEREGRTADEGKKARRFVENSDWQGIVDRFESILEDVALHTRNKTRLRLPVRPSDKGFIK